MKEKIETPEIKPEGICFFCKSWQPPWRGIPFTGICGNEENEWNSKEVKCDFTCEDFI